jgi:glycosyltransferase involved in cell wall biosynthesis
VAFVHDYLIQFGGAERVLLEMQQLYPSAPLYTSLYDPRAFEGRFDRIDVRTSFLQRIPGAARNFRALLPVYPRAFESFDLSSFDMVISSTTSFAKGVRVGPEALHVSYVNTPTRFLWYPEEYAADIVPLAARPLLALIAPALRRWDYRAAQRPHHLIANSRNVAQRIANVYGRTADVVHCPADVEGFAHTEPRGDYYLVMSRLLPYKRVHLAIEACNRLKERLIVAGSGPDLRRLQALAGPTIEFAGFVDEARRRKLIAGSKALIVPGIEDFGLVPIEAAAARRPTIAYAAGGALETVVEGETGLFFREPNAGALAAVLQSLSGVSFSAERMRTHAAAFAPEVFRSKLKALVERYFDEFQARRHAVSS